MVIKRVCFLYTLIKSIIHFLLYLVLKCTIFNGRILNVVNQGKVNQHLRSSINAFIKKRFSGHTFDDTATINNNNNNQPHLYTLKNVGA